MAFLEESAPYPFGRGIGMTTVGLETEVSSASYIEQTFTVNQAANDLYLRIISVQNADRLLLDDFDLTGYTLGLKTPPASRFAVSQSGLQCGVYPRESSR